MKMEGDATVAQRVMGALPIPMTTMALFRHATFPEHETPFRQLNQILTLFTMFYRTVVFLSFQR